MRTGKTRPGFLSLSARQRQVAKLAARGLIDKEIAAELCISEETVGFHLRHIFLKLKVRSRIQLTLLLFIEKRLGGEPRERVASRTQAFH